MSFYPTSTVGTIKKSTRNEYCDTRTRTDRLHCSDLLPGPPPSAGRSAALASKGEKRERNIHSVSESDDERSFSTATEFFREEPPSIFHPISAPPLPGSSERFDFTKRLLNMGLWMVDLLSNECVCKLSISLLSVLPP